MANFESDFGWTVTGVNDYEYDYAVPNHSLSDEEILERMDIKVIEKFLRKKKLEKITKL